MFLQAKKFINKSTGKTLQGRRENKRVVWKAFMELHPEVVCEE